IENLCTIWIGRFHLHANAVRFQRETKSSASQPHTANPKSFTSKGAVNNSFADILKSSNTNPNSPIVLSPAIVLDDSCIVERDLSPSLMGKIKDINAMSNLYRILANEGFENVKLSYLGGMWVLMELDSIESKEKINNHVGVRSWFSKLKQACNSFVTNERIVWIYVEDNENSSLPFKRLCLKTKPYLLINDKVKINMKGQIYYIRVKELEAWCPDFDVDQEDNNSLEEESECDFVINKSDNFEPDNEDEIDHVSDSSCMHNKDKPSNSNESADPNKSKDPFEIYKILKNKKEPEVTKSDEPQFPLGFTPEVVGENVMEFNSEKIPQSKNILADNNEMASSD
ncbi:hypothetical protein Tco_1059102, partial [Tanacetum coccineum]